MPKLSVVIPTKNRSDYLTESINSILKQTFKDWELIVIDDHSKENIKKVVQSFNDKRIKYYRLKGGTGISAARNFGNSKAQAKIIVVADSDDPSYPTRLQETYNYFKNYPKTDVFYSNLDVFFEKTSKKITRWFQPYKKELIYQINFIPHPASAYKKKKFFKVGGYDEKFKVSEDYDLWLSFTDANACFGYIQQPLALLQLHSANTSLKFASKIKSYLKKIRQKHNINKSDINIKIVKKLAKPAVYKAFATPFQQNLWFYKNQ